MSKRTLKANPSNPAAESLTDFIDQVEKIVVRWSPGREYYPWFRGINDATYSLVPRIYRPGYRHLEEDNYRVDFKLRARGPIFLR
jgi:hypothetical protein